MPIVLRLLRAAIHLLGLVSPALAGSRVYRLWFRPFRFPEPQQEQEWRRSATPLTVAHRSSPLAVEACVRLRDVLVQAA